MVHQCDLYLNANMPTVCMYVCMYCPWLSYLAALPLHFLLLTVDSVHLLLAPSSSGLVTLFCSRYASHLWLHEMHLCAMS